MVAAILALAVVSAAVVAMRLAESSLHTFRITLGLKDKEPTDWSGRVAVSGGDVAELTGWRFEAKDVIEGKNGWKVSTRKYIAPEHRFPIQPASGKPKTPAVLQPWPTGITLRVRGATPSITLTLPKGELKFEAPALLLGEPKNFLEDAVRIERLPAESPLRELDNVILEPHSAGGTPGWQNTFERIAENLRRVEAGRTVIQPLRQGDPQPGVPS